MCYFRRSEITEFECIQMYDTMMQIFIQLKRVANSIDINSNMVDALQWTLRIKKYRLFGKDEWSRIHK